MNTLGKSWQITKLSLKVLKNNKDLIFFPIISGIFTFAFLGIMLILFALNLLQQNKLIFMDYIMFFLVYITTYLIINFFNACLIYSTKKAFNNEKIDKSESIKNSLIIIKRIFFWTLFSSTFGITLDLIDSISKRIGKTGKIIINTMNYLLGLMWGILSKLVLPIIIYNNLSPIRSTKKSIDLIKNTWGKNLINYQGIGMAQFYLSIVMISLIILSSIFLIFIFGTKMIIIILILGLMLMIFITIMFSTVRQIINTSLFLYASKQKVPKEFDKNLLKKFFK